MSQHFRPPPDARPLRRPPANVLQFRARASATRWTGWWPFAVLPPLAFLVAFTWGGPGARPDAVTAEIDLAKAAAPWAGQRSAAELEAEQPSVAPMAVSGGAADTESARFFVCGSGPRSTCVVDGDTFWFRGAKIRIADINTPEVSSPGCPGEAALGARATVRLTELLNAGAFSLAPAGRDEDRYGRKLRIVTRGGESLGERLVDEGLAERWQGFRRTWC